jgi:hypothetical protein
MPHRRPPSITALGCVFVAAGVAGLIATTVSLMGGGASSAGEHTYAGELALVVTVRALAVVGGALILRGVSWARWLLVAWMAWHVVLSIGHTPGELAVHALLLVLVLVVLFGRQASDYFSEVSVRDGSGG